MNAGRTVRRLSWTLCLSLLVTVNSFAQATQTKPKFEPQVGQEGKDVVWVPTPQALVDKMLDMAKVTAKDYVMDLGSGDGRTVITAAKRGARATGIEYNPDMVALSQDNARAAGVTNARFVKADVFETDFSEATVITMFLLPELNVRLRPKILSLKPGTRIVSNTFTMAEWEPDQTVEVTTGCQSWCKALLWIVPAKVDGTWELPGGQLALKQTFQMLSGTLNIGGKSTPISNARMLGDQITFMAGSIRYLGHVSGSTMTGTLEGGGTKGQWTAKKTAQASKASE